MIRHNGGEVFRTPQTPSCGVFQALIVVVFLGWLFVPIYIKAGVNTLHTDPLQP